MRNNLGIKSNGEKSLSDKIIMYSCIGVAVLVVILGGLLIYSKNLSDEVKDETMSLEQMAAIAGNNTSNESSSTTEDGTNTQSASTQIGKSVEESENETNNTSNTANTTNTNNATNGTTSSNTLSNSSKNTTKSNSTNNTEAAVQTDSETSNQTNTESSQVELSFAMPVEGEIVREFAKDNLVYSETLQEWVTHTGIDIKAEKTTVVKAAEAGTVKSIKNDPRYGLTIVIEHEGNFQTVYSNLLTSEFVVEGEKVEKGQSIGTVGNTAVFEIADEPHLHFEIIKDSIQEDPSIYLNF